ncbi:MAG: phage holin family protein [Anaerolineae bacterium]|jgi:putative membrane protein
MKFLVRLVITAIALWVAVQIVPGISYEDGILGMLGMALIFGLVNALIRPIINALTCPLIILTLGLFTLVVNALMLWLASAIAGGLGVDFVVQDFWAALLGSIVVSIVSIVLSIFVNHEK